MKKEIVRIKLNKIIPNKNQPRLDFYDDSIKGLAESIKQNGLWPGLRLSMCLE